MQRLKCSVAESEGHRIVFHNLNLTVMRKEIHIVSNPNRGGWDAKRPNADRASQALSIAFHGGSRPFQRPAIFILDRHCPEFCVN